MFSKVQRLLHRSCHIVFVGLIAVGAVTLTYETVPDHNTAASHFDTLIVLGSPSDPDGQPSLEQRERVMEAVREIRAGKSHFMIVTGGRTMGPFIEAEAMAGIARQAGIPSSQVIQEAHALNTLQNIFYSERIMQQNGWKSAEVISSPSHMPRTGLILEHWDFMWRTQSAPWPSEYTVQRLAPYYIREALGTTFLRWFGFSDATYLPPKNRIRPRPRHF